MVPVYKLTVAVLTYNRANLLTKMLDSILVQTYTNFYVLISDNCSQDNTTETVLPYLSDKRFSYIKHDTTVFNCNYVIENCKTEYLLVVHDDDTMLPDMIEKQIAVLEADINVSIVFTNINYIDMNGVFIQEKIICNPTGNINNNLIIKSTEYLKYYINNGFFIACPTVMFRVSILRSNNILFKDNIGKANDLFLWLELNQLPFTFYFINTALYNYRIHDQQDSNNLFEMLPLLKIPVYNLLIHNQYPKKLIFGWLKYVNRNITELFFTKKDTSEIYKKMNNNLFLPKKTEIYFSIKLYLAIHIKLLYMLIFKVILKIPELLKKLIKIWLPPGILELYRRLKLKLSKNQN